MASAYDRRNERARALGYDSYYHFRISDNGRRPPDAPRPTGERLRRLRGHAGAADLRRAVGFNDTVRSFPIGERDKKTGQYQAFAVDVKDFETGETREFRLQGAALKQATIERLIAELEARGAILEVGYLIEKAE